MKKKAKAKSSSEPPTILDPRIFSMIETLCRDAIAFGSNHSSIRRSIANLVVGMRLISLKAHGFETVDTHAISHLLRRTRPLKEGEMPDRPPADPDPIGRLSEKRRGFRPLLTPEQVDAANVIRAVWRAWGRSLVVAGRGFMSSGGGQRSSTVDPYQLMGETLHESWRTQFQPWFDAARRRTVPCKRTKKNLKPTDLIVQGRVHVVEIVFQIVVSGREPRVLDRALHLDRGRALDVLIEELNRFNALRGIGEEGTREL